MGQLAGISPSFSVCPPSLFQVAALVSVAAPIPTIPTSCTRTSVIGECVLWAAAAAPRTAAAATTVVTAAIAAVEAAGMGTAPPPLPPHTEIAATETEGAAMAPAPIHTTSTRITTAAVAVASTAPPGAPLVRGAVEWCRPHLRRQFPSL